MILLGGEIDEKKTLGPWLNLCRPEREFRFIGKRKVHKKRKNHGLKSKGRGRDSTDQKKMEGEKLNDGRNKP